jgi:4-amino-4-deoxy-L-arabinose transferase-like glycosyltransferase
MIAKIFNSKHNPRSFLIFIIGISVLFRVVAAIYLGDKVVDLPGTYDQISYHTLALRVLGGHGFSFGVGWWPATPANQPTAHWSYLYTLYLVLVYFIFGPHPIAARIIQAVVVGIFQPYLTFKIGQKIFGDWVGIVAALLSSIYIYFIYYSATLMTEPFYIASILWALLLLIDIGDLPSKADHLKPSSQIKLSICLGLALTIGVLLRQLLLIVVPFLLLWIWLVRWSKYRKLSVTTTAIVAGVMLFFILPITFYNYQRFHRFVLLNTNSGFAFFWGNNPIYGSQFQPILSGTTYGQLIPEDVRSLNEAAMDQELLKRGIGFVISDPVRYILLSISRIPFYFEFWPTPGSGFISNISRVLSFGIMLPFMLYGMIAAIFNLGVPIKDSWSSPEVMLILFSVLYATIHILTWTLVRYRLPIDAVFLVFAGYALSDLYRRIMFRFRPVAFHTRYKSSQSEQRY